MAKRRQKQADSSIRVAEKRKVPGMLAGRPTVGGVIALMAIALVIGVCGGYLAFRVAGPGAPAADQAGHDPTTPLRARLLQNPQDVEALLGLAHIHLDQERLDDAEAIYRQVLSLQPKNVEAITHLGTVLLRRGQAVAALREYDAALAIQPDYVHALWDKATLLQQVMQDYPAAIRTWEAFARAVGLDSQDAKTAERFISEAREAMQNASPVDKAFGKKS
jgi:cytochrome c-type biogenesis protein CcmH/NrfG